MVNSNGQKLNLISIVPHIPLSVLRPFTKAQMQAQLVDARERPFVIQYNGNPMVLFYGHSKGKPSRYFSNFAPAPITVNTNTIRGNCDLGVFNGEVTLPTSEHYLMLRKALLFNDNVSAVHIIAADTPAKAKARGRAVKNYDEETWARERLSIMVDGLMLKFGAEPLREYLLSTGEAMLVECSPTDAIWGIGLKIGELECFQQDKWRGLNLLGSALMEARRRLRG